MKTRVFLHLPPPLTSFLFFPYIHPVPTTPCNRDRVVVVVIVDSWPSTAITAIVGGRRRYRGTQQTSPGTSHSHKKKRSKVETCKTRYLDTTELGREEKQSSGSFLFPYFNTRVGSLIFAVNVSVCKLAGTRKGTLKEKKDEEVKTFCNIGGYDTRSSRLRLSNLVLKWNAKEVNRCNQKRLGADSVLARNFTIRFTSIKIKSK